MCIRIRYREQIPDTDDKSDKEMLYIASKTQINIKVNLMLTGVTF